MNKSFSWEAFDKAPLVGIMRNIPKDKAGQMASIFDECGLTNLEVTMNSADAEEILSYLAREFGSKFNIGAGTVCSLQDLGKALDAGASFIVTPILNEDVVKLCVSLKIPVFPGAYTPTEIYKAWSLGANMVKVFPATKLGTQYIRDILAPLNQIKLMPTGGINLENFTDFLKAGASGVGIGSDLFPPHLIKDGDWDAIREIFTGFRNRYEDYKQEKNL